jgi:2-oxoglutarate ferredoxin oxidoreductase subunit delta
MHIRYREKPFGFAKPKPVRGQIVIIEDRCKGCGFCVEYCPNDVLKISDKYNSKGYHPPYLVNEEDCVDCGFCQMICPDFAIFSVEVEPEEQEHLNSAAAEG